MTSIDTTYDITHTGGPTGLTDLVGDTGAFLSDVWAVWPAVFHSDIAADFLTPAEIWAMIDRGLLVHPYFRVVQDGVAVPTADVSVIRSVQTKPFPSYADADAVRARYADGHTVVLDEAGHWHAGTQALLDGLRAGLRAEAHAAAVLAPPDATVVDGDEAHVLVVQLAGQAQWQAGEFVVTLQPGDVLYVPAWTPRLAVAAGDSLHLSLTVTPPTVRDFVTLALASFLSGGDVERIAGSHHFLTPEQKVAWLRTALARHLTALNPATLTDDAVALRERGGRP